MSKQERDEDEIYCQETVEVFEEIETEFNETEFYADDESPEGIKYTAIPRQSYRPGFDGELSTEDCFPEDIKWALGIQPLNEVIDVLFVKQIERQIGRYLDEVDLAPARMHEHIFLETVYGYWDTFQVPVYEMPSGLQLNLKDLTNAMIAKALWKRVQGAA